MEVVMNSSLSEAGFGHWYDNMADGGRVDFVYGHGVYLWFLALGGARVDRDSPPGGGNYN